jgi:hypothetical protein
MSYRTFPGWSRHILLAGVVLAASIAVVHTRAAAAADCPGAEGYANKWLVITGSYYHDNQAKVAAFPGRCVVAGSALAGLNPDVFVVVAGAHSNRAAALAQVKRLGPRDEYAYAKPAGRFCAAGPAPAPFVAGQISEIDETWLDEAATVTDTNKSGAWQFKSYFFKDEPRFVEARFTSAGVVHSEAYSFILGGLIAARHETTSSATAGKRSEKTTIVRRYYFVTKTCYTKSETLPRDGRTCATVTACDPSVAKRIAARAEQIAKTAQLQGDELARAAKTLDAGAGEFENSPTAPDPGP